MIDWIKTNTLDLAERRGKVSKPHSVHMMLSPYDVPNAVRTYHDGDDTIIEFRYISIKENTKTHEANIPGVSLILGEKTDRIYKIIIDKSLIDKEEQFFMHPVSIENAIDSFIAEQESHSKKTSKYSATLSAIKDYAHHLQESVQAKQQHSF